VQRPHTTGDHIRRDIPRDTAPVGILARQVSPTHKGAERMRTAVVGLFEMSSAQPMTDVGGVSPVPVCRCGRGEGSPGADAGGVSGVQM
jgi:hypothetical protein